MATPVAAQWHDTKTLKDNLRVFERMVWRDYLKPQCVQLADQLRCNQNSWDRFDAAKSIWEHVANYPYIAPPVGEELYQSIESFMSRPGGDCDNKTLVSCCLMLASGVPCRAVVIEVPDQNGAPSGEGHMYPEAKIPGMGWVAFDPSRRVPPPTFRGHAVRGWRRATVDFSGSRPNTVGAETMRTLGHSMMSAGMLTGQLHTGAWASIQDAEAWCGKQRADADWMACYDKGPEGWGLTDVAASAEKEPSWWDRFTGTLGNVALARVRRDLGVAPPSQKPVSGGMNVGVGLALVGGLVAVALFLRSRKPRVA